MQKNYPAILIEHLFDEQVLAYANPWFRCLDKPWDY
jgi:hypothetical protein